jgi:hypothetical protein
VNICHKILPLAAAAFLSLGLAAGPASAGRIIATGHDTDFHFNSAMTAFVSFARGDAPNPSLPVLTFDAGSELTSLLTSLGIAFTNINPNLGVPDASNFDVTKFSVIAVASDTTCGGCDNNTTSSTNLAAAKTSFASFFNAGGGIIALAGANNLAYYNFLPETASSFGSPPSTGFYATAAGTAAGIPPQNGDPTHNFFREPGTFGSSALWQVAERNTLGTASTADDPAETIFLAGGTVVCPPGSPGCVIVGPGPGGGTTPEPGTLALLGLALAGVASIRRRKQHA